MSKKEVGAINKELLAYQCKWYDDIVKNWAIKSQEDEKKRKYFLRLNGTKSFGFSEPFFTSVYKEDRDLPIVLFVGQETNRWGNYSNFVKKTDINGAILDSQAFVAGFTHNNVVKGDRALRIQGSKAYDSHAFWNFIRAVCKKSQENKQAIQVVWTELDKIHYSCPNDKCIKLWGEDEIELNREVIEGRTMLLLEIETIKPDLVVFLTGPNYAQSMRAALLDDSLGKPTKKNLIKEFSTLEIHCIWTYHPNSLCRQGLWDNVLNRLVHKIEEL